MGRWGGSVCVVCLGGSLCEWVGWGGGGGSVWGGAISMCVGGQCVGGVSVCVGGQCVRVGVSVCVWGISVCVCVCVCERERERAVATAIRAILMVH